MKKALLIAEKPSLMRDIQKTYNKMSFKDDISFTSVVGHIVELKEPHEYDENWKKWKLNTLPMIPNDFSYKPSQRTLDIYRDIKNKLASGSYDYVINACDAGREGELIFYALYKQLKCKLPVKRFWSSNTTEKGVKKALNNLIDDSEMMNLKASAQYRAYFDWLIGMNFTRAFSLNVGSTISIGRVMTPTLAIIVNRELEIKNFVPENYYRLKANIKEFKDGQESIWYNLKTKSSRIYDEKEADAIKGKIGKKGVVTSIKSKKITRNAPTLYSLSELQKDCNKLFGYSPKETLDIAQSLYEEKKLLSYPRTSSRFLPKDITSEIPNHLKALTHVKTLKPFVDKILGDKKKMDSVLTSKRYVDDAKVTDHHAIIPMETTPNLSTLSRKESNVYQLVSKRLISIFMPPFIIEKSRIVIDANGEKLVTKGNIVIDKGYTDLFSYTKEDKLLPKVSKGQELTITNVLKEQNQTKPPSRYTGGSIIDEMQKAGSGITEKELRDALKETAGLGTEATRADIIEKLQKIKYVKQQGKTLVPTEKGIEIIEGLKNKDIVSPKLTANWEHKLQQIENGELEPTVFYKEMLIYIKKETNLLKDINANITNDKIVGKCPRCGSDVIDGKKFYVCEKRKDSCKFVTPKVMLGTKISKKMMQSILENKLDKVYTFKINDGTSKGKFIITEYKGKKTINVDFISEKSKKSSKDNLNSLTEQLAKAKKGKLDSLGKCPHCNSDVVEVETAYMCSNYDYPDGCQFSLSKKINEADLSKEDLKLMLTGSKSSVMRFKWKNGKYGKAQLYYKDKLKFDFC